VILVSKYPQNKLNVTATDYVCDTDRATAVEALRRSQYKFPGRQKIIVSKNWGFTPLRREEYIAKRQEGRVRVDGAYVQFLRNKGPLEYNIRRFPDAFEAEA
jgi:large subunit ribosomal protein L10e